MLCSNAPDGCAYNGGVLYQCSCTAACPCVTCLDCIAMDGGTLTCIMCKQMNG